MSDIMQGPGLILKNSRVLVLLMLTFPVQAQKVVKLWPGVAPGSEHWKQKEVVVRDTSMGEVATNATTRNPNDE